MKIAFAALSGLILMACQGNTQEKASMKVKTQKDSVSYGIGMNIANNFKKQEIDIDPEMFGQAVKDVLSGAKTQMTQEQATDVLAALQGRMMAVQQEKMKVAGEKNKKEGDAFLAENKKKDGVKTTASGLQYKVIKMGTGPKPKADQTVTVNYRGTLIDGTEFDSSEKQGGPATQPCNKFIQGWVEALQMMPVGSKWQLFVPPDLAYGNQAASPEIGPQSVLIFEVELLEAK